MAARGIPRNPNVPTPPTPRGLEMHSGRTVVLLALLVLIIYLIFARSAPVHLFAPELRSERLPAAPRLATALPSAPQAAVAPQPIVGEARAQLPKDRIAAVLHSFNQAFGAARLSAEPTELSRVATGDWLAQEQRRLGELRAQGLTEQWTLLQLDIGSVASNRAGATACTVERWARVRVQPGLSGPVEEFSYTERYTLQRQGERWLVSQIEYLDGPCSAS